MARKVPVSFATMVPELARGNVVLNVRDNHRDNGEGFDDRRETRRGGGSKPESTGTGTGTK